MSYLTTWLTGDERKRSIAQHAAMAPRWNKIERTKRFEVWLTPEEFASLTAAADAKRMPTATWARELLCAAAKPKVEKRKPVKAKAKKKGGAR